MPKFRNEHTCSNEFVAKWLSECQWIDTVHFFWNCRFFHKRRSPIRNLMNLKILSRWNMQKFMYNHFKKYFVYINNVWYSHRILYYRNFVTVTIIFLFVNCKIFTFYNFMYFACHHTFIECFSRLAVSCVTLNIIIL